MRDELDNVVCGRRIVNKKGEALLERLDHSTMVCASSNRKKASEQ